ncbi:MAG: family 43 glycosylhydrolase [Clostridium sp.]|nr:family 43 glycosylhydrolase [Clostridium sp.]
MADDIVTKTKTYTDKVRTAMYGKEVRSSIADSIDKIAQNVKDEIARDELSKDVSSLNDDVTYLNGDLEKLLLKRERLIKSVSLNNLNRFDATYDYEVGKKYLVELKCEKTKGKIFLSTYDGVNVVDEDILKLSTDVNYNIVEFAPTKKFTKWQLWVTSDVDNTNITLNIYEYGHVNNSIKSSINSIEYTLGGTENKINIKVDTHKGGNTFVPLALSKGKLYHFKITGAFTAGMLAFSTVKNDYTSILEENFWRAKPDEKEFYFVPNIDSNKLQTYTGTSIDYVGDNPLAIEIEEINLLSLNVVFLPTNERLKLIEDCIVFDSDERNLYIHKKSEWFKVFNENSNSEYETGVNPVINVLPNDISQLADPTVIRFNNCFYLFSTGDRIPIFKSSDMVNWEFYKYMISEEDFNVIKSLTDNFLGTWAPDVVKIGDKWVGYVSLADNDYINKCKVIAFTADRPDEEWTYKNIIVDTKNNGVKECIDPDVIVENGIPYMFVGSFYNIYLFKLNSDGLTVNTSYEPKIIAKSGVVEGSYIYKKGGYYYLFLSNGTSGKDGKYKLKVARSNSIDGTYYNKDGTAITNDGSLATTILEGNGVNTFSVGHNGDIFTDRNGKYFIPFHGYTNKTTKRRLFIQELLWGEDGFPYFANNKCSLDFKIPKF